MIGYEQSDFTSEPNQRLTAEDADVAIAFLATTAAKLITGETMYMDGGYYIID